MEEGVPGELQGQSSLIAHFRLGWRWGMNSQDLEEKKLTAKEEESNLG